MKKLLLAFLLIWCSVSVFSQKNLVLENAKKFKRIMFRPGDYIRFQTFDGAAKYNGIIESVDDSVIVLVKIVKMANEGDATNNVFRDYIPIREIAAIYDDKKSYWKFFKNMYSGTAMVGGGLLITISALNALIENDAPERSSIAIAAGILVSGFIVRYIGRDKYKIGKRWQVKAMNPMVLDEELQSQLEGGSRN